MVSETRRSRSACTLRGGALDHRSGGILLVLVLLASSSLAVAGCGPVWALGACSCPGAQTRSCNDSFLAHRDCFSYMPPCKHAQHTHSIHFDSIRLHAARLPASYTHCSPGRMCAAPPGQTTVASCSPWRLASATLSPPHARRSGLRQSDVVSLSEARSIRRFQTILRYFVKYVLFPRVLAAAPQVPEVSTRHVATCKTVFECQAAE